MFIFDYVLNPCVLLGNKYFFIVIVIVIVKEASGQQDMKWLAETWWRIMN